jgi:ribose transport system ATP-binding protein
MSVPLLEMKGICKRFPGVVALDQISLSVYPAEVLALVGENGAGKSTLMKIIGGIYGLDEGTIRLDDSPVEIHSVSDAIRLGISFIHQELNVFDNLDLAGNIFFGREPRKWGWLSLIDRERMYASAQTYLRRLGLDISSRTPLSKLSIAQRQLVEIAKALSQNARLLIMDEPTSSLTLAETERLIRVVSELRAQGVSIIYISHRLGEVKSIADRVLVLRDGRNVGQLSRDEISHERLVQMMVGRDLARFYPHAEEVGEAPYFEVKNVRTTRYPHQAVSFNIRQGEILGLAGLVGAGRSELAQALFGVDAALAGEVVLNSMTLKINSPREAIARGIYLIPEDRRRSGLILEDCIRENITLPALRNFASMGFIKRAAERRAANESFHRLNIKAPSIEERAGNLSGGNQQKVVLARWLALEPKVLIFDEPTRGIDVGAKAEIYDLMRKLAASGVAILMISSDMEEILGVSDRVAVMHEGRLAGTLERHQFTEESVMSLAIGRA